MARQIKSFRVARQLTQEEMSEKLWISPRSYYDLEHGKYNCSMLTGFQFLLCLDRTEVIELLDNYEEIILQEADRHDVT